MQPRVVIVGAGQAGFQAAASLREEGYEGPVTLVGAEPGLPYQRPPLSKGFLTGKTAGPQLALRPQAFFAAGRIELLAGERVEAIDRAAREVRLASGSVLAYGHLVLATGALPRMPAIPGTALEGVQALRTLEDARALAGRLAPGRRLVVVGAGFIGMEVAAIARGLGLEVDLLEFAGRAMQRSVSEPVAAFLAGALAQQGVRLHFSAGARSFQGEGGQVRAVATSAGQALPADAVLVGVGVEPEVSLAASAGLAVHDGILVDEQLRTADPAISAIGDCARFAGPQDDAPVRIESVQNAVDQARCVAARLAGRPAAYRKVPWFWSDQGEHRLQIAGLAGPADEAVLRGDPATRRFSVLRLRAGRLVAVESINHAGDHMAARKLLAAGPVAVAREAADPGVPLGSLAPAQVPA